MIQPAMATNQRLDTRTFQRRHDLKTRHNVFFKDLEVCKFTCRLDSGTLMEISFVWRLLDQAQGVEKTITSTNLPSWIHYSLNQQFLNSSTTFKSTLFKIYYCRLHHIAFSTVCEHWHLLRTHIIYMHSLAASVPTKDVKYSTFHRYFRCACTSQRSALFMYV